MSVDASSPVALNPLLTRRRFGLLACGGLFAASQPLLADDSTTAKAPLFRISLAHWSLHRDLFD